MEYPAASYGAFHPRGSRQIYVQAHLLGSLLTGIKDGNMDHRWSIEVWGVRGSAPTPGRDFMEYGGNTSCILAERGNETVIFDAGSGLLGLGKHLKESGKKRLHILLSHLHIDHINGLFGFPLFLDPEGEIHLYGRGGEGGCLWEQLKCLLGRPYWPLGPEDFPAQLEIHEIRPGEAFYLSEREENPVEVRTLEGNHPGGSLLYRLEVGGQSIVYGLDCEMDGRIARELKEFSREAQLLIWDANFTEEDRKIHPGWGHSSWEQGLWLARESKVKMVLMTHFSREYTDECLRQQQKLAEGEDQICRFAKEGMVIRL